MLYIVLLIITFIIIVGISGASFYFYWYTIKRCFKNLINLKYIYISNVSVFIISIYYGQALLISNKKLHFLFSNLRISSVNVTSVKHFVENKSGNTRIQRSKKRIWVKAKGSGSIDRNIALSLDCGIASWICSFDFKLGITNVLLKKTKIWLQFLNSSFLVDLCNLAHFHDEQGISWLYIYIWYIWHDIYMEWYIWYGMIYIYIYIYIMRYKNCYITRALNESNNNKQSKYKTRSWKK